MPTDDQREAEELDEDEVGGTRIPPDQPLGVEDFGTTEAEERYGEPLDERVQREQPDVGAAGAAGRSGPAVEIAEVEGEPDTEGEAVPLDNPSDAGDPLDPPPGTADDLPAEEAAVEVRDEPG